MEPSWTSPIPQAMQQQRGSQLQKPKPADTGDAAQRTGAVAPALGAQAVGPAQKPL